MPMNTRTGRSRDWTMKIRVARSYQESLSLGDAESIARNWVGLASQVVRVTRRFRVFTEGSEGSGEGPRRIGILILLLASFPLFPSVKDSFSLFGVTSPFRKRSA